MSEEQTTEQEQAAPATPQEAYDQAVAALDEQQYREYRQRQVHAVSAGLPTPPPPGYRPPAATKPTETDVAIQVEEQAAHRTQLEEQIVEAQAAGDWPKSFRLKSALTDIINRERRDSALGGGRR